MSRLQRTILWLFQCCRVRSDWGSPPILHPSSRHCESSYRCEWRSDKMVESVLGIKVGGIGGETTRLGWASTSPQRFTPGRPTFPAIHTRSDQVVIVISGEPDLGGTLHFEPSRALHRIRISAR